MKKIFVFLLCLLVVFSVACGEPTVEESRFLDGSVEFTTQNLPKICATPYTEAMAVNMVSAILGCDTATAKTLITVCDSTDDCYEELMKSHCDIVIAHDYGQDIVKLLNSTELKLVMTELDRDALIFTTNGAQGVESVSVEQLKSVYNGEVTDWKELDGNEMAITLFGAKSRTAMHNALEKYVLTEAEIPPVTRPVITANGTFTAEIDYDNRNGAIGYTLLSLSGNLAGGSIKALSVDGVAPSKQTVKTGQYLFGIAVNIAIRNSEKPNSNTRFLYDWAISEQGKLAIGNLY
ncbi:MAG: substrate-binding domain-containing protein [Clostridia bacterium]|nr:substrate-binding domain-containing protein [Clostridia bacterium]